MKYYLEYAEVVNAAVNILAVEHLIKTNNEPEYSRRINQLQVLIDNNDLSGLEIALSLNMHIGNLGEMITQGDYDDQVELLYEYLDKNSKFWSDSQSKQPL